MNWIQRQLRRSIKWTRSQSTQTLIGASFIVGLAVGGFLGTADANRLVSGFLQPSTQETEPRSERTSVTQEPTQRHRQLDGKLVEAEKYQQFPYCVMVENAAFDGVRPQSGLSEAEIVYELIVEGGITRFMAVYGKKRPERIGPVRSARDNFIAYAAEYNCPYYHAGGSDTGLQQIRDLSMRDVDALVEYQYFWRDPLKFGPHDLFTSGSLLKEGAKNHNWLNEELPDFEPWSRIDEKDAKTYTKSRPSDKVQLGFDPGYQAEWNYNGNTTLYTRKTAGRPHVDAETGKPLSAKNIVILHVGDGTPIPGKGRINWPVIGKGKADVIYNGRAYRAFWSKKNPKSRTLFTDAQGQPFPLAIGHTWVQIAPPHVNVTIE